MFSQDVTSLIQKIQQKEITEHTIYNKLAERSNETNAELLRKIADDEHEHYSFWKGYTQKDFQPKHGTTFFFLTLCRLFGLTFILKIMEGREDKAQKTYSKICGEIPEVKRLFKDENKHEKQPNKTSQTNFSKEEIETWVRILRRKQQIIIQGPPGTGKTFVAERLARLIVSETTGFWDVVQFHSAFSYEDFIQGFHPVEKNGMLIFELKSGRFLEFCYKASKIDVNSPCILLIDEINRANLARVFGELMYLLEYRDKEISLAAGGEKFQIPKNVYLIGTMNTADRSIALVDYALRRRFSFIRLEPKYDILKKYLDDLGLSSGELINTLSEINQAIDDQNFEVGISFFMRDGLRLKELMPTIWKSEIEPYLEEYFYDQPGKVMPFRWDNLVRNNMRSWIGST
ncbi:MAG: AAA family ATPase [Candidatus Bathyarchaeota archaeon]